MCMTPKPGVQLAKEVVGRMEARGHIDSLVNLSCILVIACRYPPFRVVN